MIKYFAISNFFFLLLFSNSLFCQSYSYKHYTVEDGLPSSTVYWALQDKKGFIWFGTEAGAARFDGTNFKIFSINDGVSDNEILKIYEDSKGRIWFLTFNGKLSYFLNDTIHNSENDSVLKQIFSLSHFHSFLEDSKGDIWLGTIAGIVLRISGKEAKQIHTDELLIDKGKWIYFFEDQNNNIVLVNGSRWYHMKDETIDVQSVKTKPYSTLLLSNISPGKAYIVTGDTTAAIIQVEGSMTKGIIDQNVLPLTESINSMYCNQNDLWLSTNGFGCYFFKSLNENIKNAQPEIFLKNKIVNSSLKDQEGNMWFCTAGEGVFMLKENYFLTKNYSEDKDLFEGTYSVIKDVDGAIWVGLSKGIVKRIFNNEIKIFDIRIGNSKYQRVVKMTADSSGIWCATDRSTILLERVDKNVYQKKFIYFYEGSTAFKSIYLTKTKDIVAPYFTGITQLPREEIKRKKYSLKMMEGVDRIRTYTSYTDHSGVLWVSTIAGLYSLDGKTKNYYKEGSGIHNKRITDIKEWHDSILVFATDGYGVKFFKNGKVCLSITENNGLSSNICHSLFVNKSNIWIATNQGVNRIQFRSNIPEISSYTISDGLLSNEIRDIYDDDTSLYAATSKGLSIINYAIKSPPQPSPPVYITSVSAGTKNFESYSDLKFDYSLQNLRINFVAITYQNPSRLLYRYRLNNTLEWIESKNPQVQFYSLQPDKYIFEVAAKKFNSDWSKPVSVLFEITPPFWKTTSFIFFASTLLILIAYIILKRQTQIKLRKQLIKLNHQQEIEKERNRIASDMHDDLGSDLTRISMWSRVIQEENRNLSNVKQYSEKIKDTSIEILQKMDEIIWALNPANDRSGNLLSYLNNYAIEYFEKSTIHCEVKLSENIPDKEMTAIQRRNIFLIVKESLNNIVKHSNASRVNIDFLTSEDTFELRIKDNGEGFKKEEIMSMGYGISNIQKRLKQINGSIEIVSQKNEGTELIIRVTLKNSE